MASEDIPVEPVRQLVFLDASVLIAAAHSPTGGSALALEVCHGRAFRAVVSAIVLAEARVNIVEKLSESDLLRFYQQLAALEPQIISSISPARLEYCIPIVGEKDAHVLAAALECGAAYLLTLDRRHLITPAVASAGLRLKVMTPGDFLQQVLGSRPGNPPMPPHLHV